MGNEFLSRFYAQWEKADQRAWRNAIRMGSVTRVFQASDAKQSHGPGDRTASISVNPNSQRLRKEL